MISHPPWLRRASPHRPTLPSGNAFFESAVALARELRLSRSGLFALALEEFIRRRENLDLLERINAACAGPVDSTTGVEGFLS